MTSSRARNSPMKRVPPIMRMFLGSTAEAAEAVTTTALRDCPATPTSSREEEACHNDTKGSINRKDQQQWPPTEKRERKSTLACWLSHRRPATEPLKGATRMVDTDFRWETPELQATEEVAGSAWARIAWEAAMANNLRRARREEHSSLPQVLSVGWLRLRPPYPLPPSHCALLRAQNI